jgi:hypothetical protein
MFGMGHDRCGFVGSTCEYIPTVQECTVTTVRSYGQKAFVLDRRSDSDIARPLRVHKIISFVSAECMSGVSHNNLETHAGATIPRHLCDMGIQHVKSTSGVIQNNSGFVGNCPGAIGTQRTHVKCHITVVRSGVSSGALPRDIRVLFSRVRAVVQRQ